MTLLHLRLLLRWDNKVLNVLNLLVHNHLDAQASDEPVLLEPLLEQLVILIHII